MPSQATDLAPVAKDHRLAFPRCPYANQEDFKATGLVAESSRSVIISLKLTNLHWEGTRWFSEIEPFGFFGVPSSHGVLTNMNRVILT